MIKLVCRWKCFQGKHCSVKDFFVRCIGILTKCADINSFRAVFTDVLIVALSETESINSNDLNSCFAAQTRLMKAIKSDVHCYQYENDCAEYGGIDSNQNRFDDCITGSKFIQDLVNKCKSFLTDGERPNPYHCSDFANSFIRVAKHFPLWTAVMPRDKSSVATSVFIIQ
ncbi:kda protein in nof-fb transposable element [Lasius niger]|uniref:KDa protein in nof-fb transposable element n=1 Tax=Lasius niger TaxID=67767 RepID=A0A0J7KQH0_LASNI|nr:kda protein in nof-fb transposable element [Lasius niger]